MTRSGADNQSLNSRQTEHGLLFTGNRPIIKLSTDKPSTNTIQKVCSDIQGMDSQDNVRDKQTSIQGMIKQTNLFFRSGLEAVATLLTFTNEGR